MRTSQSLGKLYIYYNPRSGKEKENANQKTKNRPHSLRVTPDQKHLVALGYFVQEGEVGILNTPADYKVHYIDIGSNGALHFNRTIPFQTEFANRGGARPHFSVIADFTDPNNPKFNSY